MPLPLLWLTIAFTSGIFLASQVFLTVPIWGVLSLAGWLLSVPLRRVRIARLNSPPLMLALAESGYAPVSSPE